MIRKAKLSLVILFFLAIILPSSPVSGDSNGAKVILLIGDGLGPNQLGLLRAAWSYGRSRGLVPDRENAYDTMVSEGIVSLVSVKPNGYLVADSACAASSMSTGRDCLPETLGLDEEGEPVEVFSEFAKRNNITLGLVSDTRITHATPAGFYARSRTRNDEKFLATQLADSGVDLAFSGGLKFFSSRKASEVDNLKKNGYSVATSKEAFDTLNKLPTVALLASSALPDALLAKDDVSTPTLSDLSKKALELFAKEKSYLLMIEAGQIDWAAHDNDAGLMLHELLKFENVLFELSEYLKQNKDTSIVILGDHETGGFNYSYQRFKRGEKFEGSGFSGYAPRYNFLPESSLDYLFSQKISLKRFSEEMRRVKYNIPKLKIMISNTFDVPVSKKFEKALGNLSSRDFKKVYKKEFPNNYLNYIDEDSLDQVVLAKYLSKYNRVSWSNGSHTVPLIPVVMGGSLTSNKFKKPLTLVEVGRFLRDLYSGSEVR